MVTQNITLDGTTNFTAFGRNFSWDGDRIDYVSFGFDTTDQNNVLNVGMTGSDWRIRTFNLFNDSTQFSFNVNFGDTTTGNAPRIDRLVLQDHGTTSITLNNARIRYIDGSETGNLTLQLGTQQLNSARLGDGNDSVTMGSGQVSALFMGSGVNSLTGGSGFLNFAEFGGGTNIFNQGSGGFGAIRVYDDGRNIFNLRDGDLVSLDGGVSTVTVNNGFVGNLLSYGGTNTVAIGATGEVRSIGFSEGVDQVTVNGGRAGQIALGSNNDRLTIQGGGQVEGANMGDGNNTVLIVNGHMQSLVAYGGNDTITIGTGQIESIVMGAGINTLTTGTGFVEFIGGYQGNDTVIVRSGGAGMIKLNDGNNRVVTGTGYVDSILTYQGNDSISIGAAGAGAIRMQHGTNTLTATGYVNFIQGGDGNDRITVNGAGTIDLGRGANAVLLTGDDGVWTIGSYRDSTNTITTGAGFVNNILTGDGIDRITIGAGNADTVFTRAGNDIINVVNGRADVIYAGAGNDTVTLGLLGARFVSLGDGDDTISVGRMVPQRGVVIHGEDGGTGTDTLDLSRFAANLTVSLDTSAFQNVAAPGGNLDGAGFGYISVIQVENLIGSIRNDVLEGSGANNVLIGGLGNDRLAGLAGNDILRGGANNDTLTGDAGLDVFVFNPGEGSDRITDFTVGDDRIELRAANGLNDLAFVAVVDDVRITFGALTILVEDITVAELRVDANFLF